jgi:hypothetical protein
VSVLDPKTVNGTEPGKGLLYGTAEVTSISLKPDDQPTPVTVGRIFMESGDVVDNVPNPARGPSKG